jgi:signal transduction histidine kinase
LRTPLTSIKGSMEYVTARLTRVSPETADSTGRDELLEFFELIRKNTDRLIRMVNTMLDIERIEMGSAGALHFSDIDLAEVISESVAGFLYAAARKDVHIVASVPETLPIRADEDRIRQVLTNLLANGIKFAPDHSTIDVRAVREREFVLVEVSDQGPGIPAAERERVIEKFYKLGNKEGSGLGLAICRSIVEAHGGTIGIADRKDVGARVYFRLPDKLIEPDTDTPERH